MISVVLASRSSTGLRLIWIRPELSVVLVPSMPIKDERLSTAGSCKMRSTSAAGECASRQGSILRRLRDADDDTGVLHREESFGDVNVKHDGCDECRDRDNEGSRLVTEDEGERAAVKTNDPFRKTRSDQR